MNNEQTVRVGIMSANEIHVVFHSTYLLDGKPFIGEFTFGCPDRPMLFQPADAEGCFTLRGVTIGIGFHWQRQEDQKFRGSLLLLSDGGKAVAIDVVPVETYLTSVISSEMSASASLELLKAHAVISRSWLLAMINKSCSRTQPSDAGRQPSRHEQLNPDSVIRWYDSEAHHIFDVCADDHCQRYQGITKETSPNVAVAIGATRGEVLMSEGDICDARFSKSCGGVSEEYQYCWENIKMPYLLAVRDTAKGVKDEDTIPDLTVEAEADKWIRTAPDAFCNTHDKTILSQVLNDFDQETTDFYRWRVEYTQQELHDLITEKMKMDLGDILDLVPVERGKSGRLCKLKIVGSKRSFTIGKELEIRRVLSTSHLYSSAFVTDKADVVDGVPQKFTLIGAGWGHGVGLCQIGAAVMGAQGYKYDQILLHYYRTADLKKLYK